METNFNGGLWYMDRATGEITQSHKEAMEWYRVGDGVSIYKDGDFKIYWEH